MARLLREPPALWRSDAPAPRRDAPDHACELCGLALAADHQHLLEVDAREVRCVCCACGVLFERAGAGGPRLRRVPDRRLRIEGFALDERRWADLAIPVRLAFLVHRSADGRTRAAYPGAMGATEAEVRPESWAALAEENPVLATLEPDVEALLVNRIGRERASEHYVVPIDACFRLVAVLRSRWRGISGGVEAWDAVRAFFDDLRARARIVDRSGRPPGEPRKDVTT